MILTKEQSESRLSSSSNIANQEVEIHPTIIYKDGVNNRNGSGKRLSEEERIAVGVIASITDDKTASELFGIHKSHANDLKNGNRNVGNGESGSSLRVQDTELLKAISSRLDKTKLTIQERAAEKLLSTLGLFDNEDVKDKMKNSTPKEIAGVASQMSQVMRNMNSSQKSEGEHGPRVNIIINSPKEAREESFDMITIGI